jgi:hypothetical protein
MAGRSHHHARRSSDYPIAFGSVAQDDWRVTVTLHEAAHTGRLRQLLHEVEVEGEVRTRLGERVAVGGNGDEAVVFLYTTSSDAAHEAERITREVVQEDGLDADFAVHRWHPIEERWEDEQVPLPATEAARELEHEHLDEDEIAESEELKMGLWEARVEFETHQDAVALAERLEAEADELLPGWTVALRRHWKYLLIGADNEDQANQIAERLQGELPAGAKIQVEPSGALVWQVNWTSPFAVFGGLGT